MTKLFLTIQIILFSITINAQKTVDAKIVLQGTTDTLFTKMRVKTNMFNSKLIDVASFFKKIVIYNQEKKEKIKATTIDYLSFIDYEDKKRVFISPKKFSKKHHVEIYLRHTLGLRIPFIEEVLYDTMSVYKNYYVGSNRFLTFDNLYVLNGAFFYRSTLGGERFSNKSREKLKGIIKNNYPELLDLVEHGKPAEFVVRFNKLEREKN